MTYEEIILERRLTQIVAMETRQTKKTNTVLKFTSWDTITITDGEILCYRDSAMYFGMIIDQLL